MLTLNIIQLIVLVLLYIAWNIKRREVKKAYKNGINEGRKQVLREDLIRIKRISYPNDIQLV